MASEPTYADVLAVLEALCAEYDARCVSFSPSHHDQARGVAAAYEAVAALAKPEPKTDPRCPVCQCEPRRMPSGVVAHVLAEHPRWAKRNRYGAQEVSDGE